MPIRITWDGRQAGPPSDLRQRLDRNAERGSAADEPRIEADEAHACRARRGVQGVGEVEAVVVPVQRASNRRGIWPRDHRESGHVPEPGFDPVAVEPAGQEKFVTLGTVTDSVVECRREANDWPIEPTPAVALFVTEPDEASPAVVV